MIQCYLLYNADTDTHTDRHNTIYETHEEPYYRNTTILLLYMIYDAQQRAENGDDEKHGHHLWRPSGMILKIENTTHPC